MVEKDHEKSEEAEDVEFGVIEARGKRASRVPGHSANPNKKGYVDMVAGGESEVPKFCEDKKAKTPSKSKLGWGF
jgi:hypothetical protein